MNGNPTNSEGQQNPELFNPSSLADVQTRVIDELIKDHYLDSGGNATELTDSAEVSYQVASDLLTGGGTDPDAISRLFEEAKEKFPEYSCADGDTSFDWATIDQELKSGDSSTAHAALEFTLATLVSDLVTATVEADQNASPGLHGQHL